MLGPSRRPGPWRRTRQGGRGRERRVARIVIDSEQCKGCGLCVDACPQHVLALGKDASSKGYFYAKLAEPRRCIGCRMCCVACPDAAIQMTAAGTLYECFAY